MSTFDTPPTSRGDVRSGTTTPEPQQAAWTRSDVRLLIANHDSFGSAYLRRVVSRLGVSQVVRAVDGCDALSKLSEGAFGILLLDLDLPDITGLEILEILRTDPVYEHLEVIVTTGVNQRGAVQRAIELGISDYVVKPYRQEFLEERIERVVHRIRERARMGGGRQAVGATLLVVDDDQNFLDMARSVFGATRPVLVAQTQAEVLTTTLRHEPACILIAPPLLGARLEFIVKTVRRISKNESLSIVLLTPKGSKPPTVRQDAVMERTYVPAKLREILSPYLFDATTVAWLEGLDKNLATATEQTFGMMAGAELRGLASEKAVRTEMAVSITLQEPDGKEWVLVLECTQQLGVALTSAMLGLEPADVGEEASSGVSEVLNVLAGRIKQCAYDIGCRLELGLPQDTALSDLQGHPSERRMTIAFQWGEIEPFRVCLLG